MSSETLLPKKGQEEEKTLGQLVKENFLPGVTVALVSVPLSAALAMAAGATPMMGLITAIWGPLIQGVMGGSNYNILGPAGALVAILHSYSAVYGDQIIPWLAFGSGVLSFLVYALGWEKYATVLPLSVLEGFSFAVGLTIGLS
jgi:SulP family sulfate permease